MNHLTDFEALDLSGVRGYVTRGQEENIHLDFKTVRDAGLASSDDRKNLACALSGFANSSGGLIVWGVDARKNIDGVDCAAELRPIENLPLFLSRLNSLTGEAADPITPSVQHRAIVESGSRGFALTLVLESDTGPHMAKLGENRYYKRAGDSFYKMEHYDIADMFGRRRRPKLAVFHRVLGSFNTVEIHLGLRNVGRATARAPFFAFESDGPLQRSRSGLDGNGNEGLNWLRLANSGLQWAYGGGMDFALHPGMAHEIACLNLGIPTRPEPTEDLVIRYAVACEDQPIETGRLVVPLEELR